jgi:hypothetical protein
LSNIINPLGTLQSEVVFTRWIVTKRYQLVLDLLLKYEALGYVNKGGVRANRTSWTIRVGRRRGLEG